MSKELDNLELQAKYNQLKQKYDELNTYATASDDLLTTIQELCYTATTDMTRTVSYYTVIKAIQSMNIVYMQKIKRQIKKQENYTMFNNLAKDYNLTLNQLYEITEEALEEK